MKIILKDIETDFEEDEDGNALGEMVFGEHSVADMAINFDAISRVIKAAEGAYMLELKDGMSRVSVVVVE